MLLVSESPLELSALDAEHVAAVLEDCSDQLAVLGSILTIPETPVNSQTVSFTKNTFHRGRLFTKKCLVSKV